MIELKSAKMRALIATRGASLAGLWMQGTPHSLVIGSDEETAYSQQLTYFGAFVGPIANRVANARLRIDGQDWTMEANEGSTCLHGGSQGLHAKNWTVQQATPRHVELDCMLSHGQGGLPGNRHITVVYRLSDDCTMRLEITAKSDRATAFNIAHHPYWNLDDAPTVSGHILAVDAGKYLPVDDKNRPTGEIAPVSGTPYDFRLPRAVPVDATLDTNFCISCETREQLHRCATLSVENGPRLEIHSTAPGLQIYNGAGLSPLPVRLHDRRILGPYAGIALEPQGWPDAPRHAHFPSIMVPAGALYRQVTEYRLSR